MLKTLTFPEFKTIAQLGAQVLVYQTYPVTAQTPVGAFFSLKADHPDMSLFECQAKDEPAFSYLGFDAIATLTSTKALNAITMEAEQTLCEGDPFEIARFYYDLLATKNTLPAPGFAGGLIGAFGFDAVRHIEALPDQHQAKRTTPDSLLRYYRHHVIFDHQASTMTIATVVTINDELDAALKQCYQDALTHIEAIQSQIKACTAEPLNFETGQSDNTADAQPHTDDGAFQAKVALAKTHIQQGDAFQIVLSRPFSTPFHQDPFDLYRALRVSNPSPYMFYVPHENTALVGASPETLVNIQNATMTTKPLAGTAPRSGDDAFTKQQLLADNKETAEHTMLVDLSRNDLGRVAKPGSVRVSRYQAVETFPRVLHISSTVQGSLHPQSHVFDALKATFPAGTLSGAPKIRAMEIIDALEDHPRGFYGGAIIGIDSQQNLTSCITIRCAFVKDQRAYVQAGAGIVYHSDPQKETNETRHKAKGVLDAIQWAKSSTSPNRSTEGSTCY